MSLAGIVLQARKIPARSSSLVTCARLIGPIGRACPVTTLILQTPHPPPRQPAGMPRRPIRPMLASSVSSGPQLKHSGVRRILTRNTIAPVPSGTPRYMRGDGLRTIRGSIGTRSSGSPIKSVQPTGLLRTHLPGNHTDGSALPSNTDLISTRYEGRIAHILIPSGRLTSASRDCHGWRDGRSMAAGEQWSGRSYHWPT